MGDVGSCYVRVIGAVRWSLLEAKISRVVECRSVCNSVVVEVGVGSLVAYRSSERSLLRFNCVLVLRTEWTNGEMLAKVCQALVCTRSSERTGKAKGFVVPLAVRASWRRWLLLCRVKAERAYRDRSYGFCRTKALRTYQAVAMTLPCQSCTDVSGGR